MPSILDNPYECLHHVDHRQAVYDRRTGLIIIVCTMCGFCSAAHLKQMRENIGMGMKNEPKEA